MPHQPPWNILAIIDKDFFESTEAGRSVFASNKAIKAGMFCLDYLCNSTSQNFLKKDAVCHFLQTQSGKALTWGMDKWFCFSYART